MKRRRAGPGSHCHPQATSTKSINRGTLRALLTSRSPISGEVLWMPRGVQQQPAGRRVVRIARSRLRVGLGTGEVIATFSPTNWLSRVDLPQFGRPIRATKPERKPSERYRSCRPRRHWVLHTLNSDSLTRHNVRLSSPQSASTAKGT